MCVCVCVRVRARSFFTSWGTESFSRRTLSKLVSWLNSLILYFSDLFYILLSLLLKFGYMECVCVCVCVCACACVRARSFFTSWGTESFSRRTLSKLVSCLNSLILYFSDLFHILLSLLLKFVYMECVCVCVWTRCVRSRKDGELHSELRYHQHPKQPCAPWI